ncbi:radical SAM protein [uncultured Desulfosarcina sp.]|uniref:radical SAM protein n=1 Tax=uncultured Desulfosarcina sp. TaxID=218289 RepID=UPI0029C7E422|nr:radical SAM protein [uncultured Desulfosarcina sp.]
MNTHSTFKYKTLFGPVPSRRLGISLGVDLVPHKTCSLNCVYCECGATTHLTLKRREYVGVDRVKNELITYLSQDEKIDYITFSGSGEPTLNEGLGDVIQFLKSDYPQYKVALLTNSTLFDQPEVRRQIKDVDVIMASLDAATDPQFRQVNRPHPELDLSSIIDGIARFRKMFSGRLLMEYFLVNGCNDSIEELTKLKIILRRIDADGVLLNTLDRPGTEAWVQPTGPKRLKDVSDFLEGAEIVKYTSAPPETTVRSEDLMARLVSTVRRRPYTAQDVSRIMGCDVESVQPVLDQLVASNQLALKQMDRGCFYMASQARRPC